jgi:hypothetical protein
VPETNWKHIKEAPRGIGDVLLRIGAGSLDGVFVGRQDPATGVWFDQENRQATPHYFCTIPLFDCDGDEAAQ